MSAPIPTADIGCDLVKISASGPMPTSRYCDHAPCAISASLRRAASGEPGRTRAKIVADDRDDRRAARLRPSPDRRAPAPRSRAPACSSTNVTPAALMCREIARREKPRRAVVALLRLRVASTARGVGDARRRVRRRESRRPDQRSSMSSLIVGAESASDR